MICRKCFRELPDDAVFCCYCGIRQDAQRAKKRKRSNGMGSVFRHRGAWAYEVTLGWSADEEGNLKRKTFRRGGFKTVKDAEDAKDAYLSSLGVEPAPVTTAKTVEDLWLSYEASELTKKGKSTQDAYRTAWRKRIKGTISHRTIDSITLDDLNAIVADCTYDPAKDVRDLMSILFQRAIVDKQTTVNPTKLMTLPTQNSNEVVPWEPSEVSSLWKAWGEGHRVAGICLLMIYSGMMPGEMLKMKEDMIHWEDSSIVGCGLKTKKRKEIPIHFPDIIEPILRELCATKCGKRGQEGYVCDMGESTFYKRFDELKTKYGIRPEVIPYSSRHSTGTELSLMGVAPAVIIDIMRHKNYTTTLKHYTKIPTATLLDTLNRMSEREGLSAANSGTTP